MTKNLNRRSTYRSYNGIDIFPLLLFFATPRNHKMQHATPKSNTQPRRNPATPRNSQLRVAGWVGWVWLARGRELRNPNGVAGLGGVAGWAPSPHECIYVCMYICMYVCMSVCLHVCMRVCIQSHVHVCIYACKHICMYAWMDT